MKQSNIYHVTFHTHKSAVLLSVPETTTLAALKSQLIPALAALPIPAHPKRADDIQFWEDRPAVEGAEGDQGLRLVESGSIKSNGWPRWKTVYLSIREADGSFPQPEYTVPDPMDGDDEA